jgi:hypothetical protein
MMHEIPRDASAYDFCKGGVDTLVDGAGRELLQPGPGLSVGDPAAAKARKDGLEKAGTATFEAGGLLAPFVFTGPARIIRDESGMPRVAELTSADVSAHVPTPVVQALGVGGLLGATPFVGGGSLRVMGVQDNYKPWSRKNWRSGKPLVIPPAGGGVKQLMFDDYSFTKSDAEACYIQAPYDEASGAFLDGDKASLQQRYSAEAPFAGAEGNEPIIFTAVLNKKGKPSAVSDTDYFLSRVQGALKLLRAAPK